MMVAAHFVPIFGVTEREQVYDMKGEEGGCVWGAEVDFTARCVRPGMTR